MNLIPFVVAWCFLAAAVLGLALYRNLAQIHEDDMIHLSAGAETMIPKQIAFFRKLDLIDHWGKTLTVITLAGGLTIAGVLLGRAW